MNKEIKAKWIEALRNGKYRRGKGVLYNDGKYCCLGVLCKVMGAEFDGENSFPPKSVSRAARLRDSTIRRLANLNDGVDSPEDNANKITGFVEFKGATFRKIADYIEQNL